MSDELSVEQQGALDKLRRIWNQYGWPSDEVVKDTIQKIKEQLP